MTLRDSFDLIPSHFYFFDLEIHEPGQDVGETVPGEDLLRKVGCLVVPRVRGFPALPSFPLLKERK